MFASKLKWTFTKQYCRSISILFYGSDDFSLTSVKLLHQKLLTEQIITKLELVTGSDKNIICKYALNNQLKCHKYPYKFGHNCYDIGVVASFGKLIPEYAINACRLGVIKYCFFF
jgi:methionyl-tRNA formyltransferase